MRGLISTLKKKKKRAGSDSSNLPLNSSQARKEPPPPQDRSVRLPSLTKPSSCSYNVFCDSDTTLLVNLTFPQLPLLISGRQWYRNWISGRIETNHFHFFHEGEGQEVGCTMNSIWFNLVCGLTTEEKVAGACPVSAQPEEGIRRHGRDDGQVLLYKWERFHRLQKR